MGNETKLLSPGGNGSEVIFFLVEPALIKKVEIFKIFVYAEVILIGAFGCLFGSIAARTLFCL